MKKLIIVTMFLFCSFAGFAQNDSIAKHVKTMSNVYADYYTKCELVNYKIKDSDLKFTSGAVSMSTVFRGAPFCKQDFLASLFFKYFDNLDLYDIVNSPYLEDDHIDMAFMRKKNNREVVMVSVYPYDENENFCHVVSYTIYITKKDLENL